jgi:hypothetical protein
MAKIVLGGQEHYIPVLNFVALERAWPFVEEAMTATSVMVGVRAGLCIIAAGVIEREDFDPAAFGIDVKDHSVVDPKLDRDEQLFDLMVYYFKKKMLANEIAAVRLAINEILQEAGLVGEEGEEGTVEVIASPSLETSTQSSLNLWQQDTKEGAGTA